MKIISLWQPWATLILWSEKQFETRTWSTGYRGKLAIHAAKKQNVAIKITCENLCQKLGIKLDFDGLPRGKVIAICDLVDCIEITENFTAQQSKKEILCGDWKPGRIAWKLENVKLLDPPIPLKGRQGLWDWDFKGE